MQQQRRLLHVTAKASFSCCRDEHTKFEPSPKPKKDQPTDDKLDDGQQRVLDACLKGSNVFYSGMGGTGKHDVYMCPCVCVCLHDYLHAHRRGW